MSTVDFYSASPHQPLMRYMQSVFSEKECLECRTETVTAARTISENVWKCIPSPRASDRKSPRAERTPTRTLYSLRKLGVTMHRCLQHKAPRYLVDRCTSVAEVPGRRHLRSANRQQLLVPRYRRNALGPRA